MQINVSSNIDQVLGSMTRWHDQYRFAVAMALTDTAREAARALPAQAERDLDRPVAYTRNAFFFTPARKHKLTATVGIKDRQAEYLRYQVQGGTRAPKRKALRLPSEIALDASGNLPKGTIARLVAAARSGRKLRGKSAAKAGITAGSRIFYGQPKGQPDMPPGLYTRRDVGGQRTLVPLIVFPQRSAHYRPKFAFHASVRRTVQRTLPDNLRKAWAQAQRTAR